MEVQILCTKMIKPSVPTPPHLRKLKLSPVDQVQYRIKTAFILYYSADGTAGADKEVERGINRLETSLSETLTGFYPLAGRYVEDGNWVDCNDEGVELFVAKVKGRLSQVVLSRRDEMIDQLVHLAGGGFTSPVLSIQITTFDCGGVVIGFRNWHKLFDGFSAVSFATSWATASKQGTDHMVWPTFGVTSILPSNDLPNMTPMPRLMGLDNGVTKRIVFDGAKISAVRARAHDPSFPREPTRVELVTALIWRARMRVRRAKHGCLRTSLAAHTINLRPRIVPPLPPYSFGNLQGRITTRFVANSRGNDTDVPALVPELKDLVGLLIDSFNKSKETVVAREDVFSTALKTRNELHEAAEKGEVDVFMFTSWCNFPFYQVDFGWGKPVWLSRIHSAYEATTLLDTEDGDGIEAWLSFNKQDMAQTLRDPDILAFTSKEAPGASLPRRQFWVTQENAERNPRTQRLWLAQMDVVPTSWLEEQTVSSGLFQLVLLNLSGRHDELPVNRFQSIGMQSDVIPRVECPQVNPIK